MSEFPARYSSIFRCLPKLQMTFSTNAKELWLTLDDGPVERTTQQALELLNIYGVRATFFVLMERTIHNKKLINDLHLHHHEIGLHGWHHRKQLLRNPKQTLAEWLDMKKRVEDIVGKPVKRFRAPYGIPPLFIWKNLLNNGLEPVWMSWYLGDYRKNTNVEKVVDDLFQKLRKGDIVLMHDGSPFPSTFLRMLKVFLEHVVQYQWKLIIP
ncbi:MAG: polysaccharide deacetylase family protein [bacterium]|nr:polysaccharide deacetylase family protein [bacterium]